MHQISPANEVFSNPNLKSSLNGENYLKCQIRKVFLKLTILWNENKIANSKWEKKWDLFDRQSWPGVCVRDVDQNVPKYLHSQELSQNIRIKTSHAEFQVRWLQLQVGNINNLFVVLGQLRETLFNFIYSSNHLADTR